MKSPTVKKASLSGKTGGSIQCQGKSVESVGSPVTVKKAGLSAPSGKSDQMGNPKR